MFCVFFMGKYLCCFFDKICYHSVIDYIFFQPTLTVNKTSDLPSWLIMKLKPRYHISGLEGTYYERKPFRAPNLNDHDTTLNLATRFLGLARVANPSKEKWLYALSLTAIDQMKIGDLLQKTTDETECPFDFNLLDQKSKRFY